MSGTPPIGYRMRYESMFNAKKGGDELVETGILEPDLEPQPRIGFSKMYTRADLVRLIGSLDAAGQMEVRPLAAHLYQQGYRNVKGVPLTGSAVRTIVENPVYAGWLSWHERKWRRLPGEAQERVSGPHEPLWSEDLWGEVQRSS